MLVFVELATLVAVVVASVTGVLVLRRRRTSPLALPLALMMFGASEWAAARALLPLATGSHEFTLALHYAIYPGIALSLAAAFVYFAVLTGRRVTRRAALLLCVQPALTMLVLATDGWHRSFLLVEVSDGVLSVAPGPLYWAFTAYSYGLLLIGVALSLRAMVTAVPGHRHVYAIAALAAVLPFIGNVTALLVSSSSLSGPIHLTPVFTLASSAIWLWVERYRDHTRAVPVSTRQVLEALTDAVVVLDPRGVLLDTNPAARVLLRDTDYAIGTPWRSPMPAAIEAAIATGAGTVTTPRGGVLDVRITQISDRAGRPIGRVVVMRDITELERLRRELADQALRDGLTGVHNRRSFEQQLADALTQARADGTPLSLLLVDLDHFKRINDTHGHATGDRVLVEVARALEASTLPGETLARLGGEEFVVLLPGLGGDEAVRRAEAVRARCAAVHVEVRGGVASVTISVGVAELPADGTADTILRDADRAMYAAKAAGRDRVARAPVAVP
ncbi:MULTISPECIES: diguanylate cyclase [unclassified Actinotalea]|uniref:histidine kinase N-terminal 7TM domain-containing diguanylate cyclase n=1 Tax=unclassified Actinotalea TaxID=2638618 RepID=UPI0015F4F558|nr:MULTISPECIES: diguanylate cyclase [unclassified Actinotalea]